MSEAFLMPKGESKKSATVSFIGSTIYNRTFTPSEISQGFSNRFNLSDIFPNVTFDYSSNRYFITCSGYYTALSSWTDQWAQPVWLYYGPGAGIATEYPVPTGTVKSLRRWGSYELKSSVSYIFLYGSEMADYISSLTLSIGLIGVSPP